MTNLGSSATVSSRWQHTPEHPVTTAPFLHLPLRPTAILRHVARSWRPHSTRVIMLVTAVVVWLWFSPSVAEAESFQLGWMAEIWIRNVVLVGICAGLPHLWLYVWRRQEDDLRFDSRPLGKNKRLFLFNDQVKDNAFLSLLPVGDFYHQLHHRFIECNYGGSESPIDDWLDSLHDGTAAGDAKIAARRRSLNAAKRGSG